MKNLLFLFILSGFAHAGITNSMMPNPLYPGSDIGRSTNAFGTIYVTNGNFYGTVSGNGSGLTNLSGTAITGNLVITNLNVGLVVMPFTNLAIFDGSRGCQFLYTNTTNPLVFFTNINVGVIYSLDIIQTNTGAAGGPWYFTNFQGGFSNSFVCWPNGVVQPPATNFGSRSHYTFTGLPGYSGFGTNIIFTSAITNF